MRNSWPNSRSISTVFSVALLLLLVGVVGCSSGTVNQNPATVTISANPTSISPGGTSVLSVVATNATQVTVTGTDGSSYSMSVGGGSLSVTPAATTTYTVLARALGGDASASTTVTVAGIAATVSITANPASISAGGSSVLTVTAANATQVSVSGSDGSSYTLSTTGGTQSVSPTVTTTYTARAVGFGGTVSATAVVTVVPPASPTITLTANPTSIASGGSSVLTAAATNATQVTITGTDGSSYTLSPTGGTQTVTPSLTTTYTATAKGASGSATATATVSVSPPNPTITLSANPTSIVSGNSSVLTATATNATQVKITGSDGSSYTLSPTGGTQTVTPLATTTYTAIATGATGNASANVTVTVSAPNTTVTLSANPTSISAGGSSVLTATATNATQVKISGSDGSNYTLSPSGGTQTVTPTATTTYTATATGAGAPASATATITVTAAAGLQSITHVVLLLQENRSFDSYFGMLNPYRTAHGWAVGDDGNTYTVDGIDDKLSKISNQTDSGVPTPLFKLKSSCIDDLTSSWLESYGDVSRYDFSPTRPIAMDGFVHTAQNFAQRCTSGGVGCSGAFTDTAGKRAMGYYDETYLNYYYYMASQFAISDRWFSPISSKSIPNRIATFTGGTTQGLVFDPGDNDHLSQLDIPNIFHELDNAKVSWKIYYTVTQGSCLSPDECTGGAASQYPATIFSYLSYSYQYLHENPGGTACVAPTQPSSVVGDTTNSFCIDPSHIAPLSQYYTDLNNGTLPSFSFIEAGYGQNDEHPGSGQSIIAGQQQVAKVVNAFMASPVWANSVFFLAYDEGGGPFEHVPPVPGHSNDFTNPVLGSTPIYSVPDISTIAKNPDAFGPCVPAGGTATLHCDLGASDPGAHSTDAAAQQGVAAQLGFRVPNLVISPFSRKHFVSHIPMDHTAIIRFVENRFIGASATLTARDAAQPNLLDFFDFAAKPWASPPTPPAPVTTTSLGFDPCTPTSMGP